MGDMTDAPTGSSNRESRVRLISLPVNARQNGRRVHPVSLSRKTARKVEAAGVPFPSKVAPGFIFARLVLAWWRRRLRSALINDLSLVIGNCFLTDLLNSF